MPKLVFWHRPGYMHRGRHIGWTEHTLEEFGHLVIPVFAEACSTKEVPISADDIDWFPVPYPSGTITSSPCLIEIETFAYDERVANLTEERMLELKNRVIDIANEAAFVALPQDREFFQIPRDKPLLWLRYQDPRGHHV